MEMWSLWLPFAYDIQKASQPYNSTQSPPRCRISFKQSTPYPTSRHLPKIVRLLLAVLLRSSHNPHTFVAVKAGYPPRPLTAVIPELPLTSLGLAPGDQLIVNQKSGSAAPPSPGVTSSTAQSRAVVNPPASVPTLSSNAAQVAPGFSEAGNGGPDYVEIDGGYLVHRVRVNKSA